jgi:hypothetical protein
VSAALSRARPLAIAVVRSTTLIVVALLLIFILLPAVLGAAGPQVPAGS